MFLVFIINQIRLDADFCLTAMFIYFNLILTLQYLKRKYLPSYPTRIRLSGEEIAARALRHNLKPLFHIHLRVFVAWWRNWFLLNAKKPQLRL